MRANLFDSVINKIFAPSDFFINFYFNVVHINTFLHKKYESYKLSESNTNIRMPIPVLVERSDLF